MMIWIIVKLSLLACCRLCVCGHSDGVRQSGLYVAISCIWERLKDSQEVDIFETVRGLRYHRPQIIHDVVCSHTHAFCRSF